MFRAPQCMCDMISNVAMKFACMYDRQEHFNANLLNKIYFAIIIFTFTHVWICISFSLTLTFFSYRYVLERAQSLGICVKAHLLDTTSRIRFLSWRMYSNKCV